MKKFVLGMLVTMMIVCIGANMAYAIHASAMLPQDGTKPTWSELCENEDFNIYLLTNPVQKNFEDGSKLALLKYVYKKTLKIGTLKVLPGFYEYVLIWLKTDNKCAEMAKDLYNQNGKLEISLDDEFLIKNDGVKEYRIEKGTPAWFIVNEQKY